MKVFLIRSLLFINFTLFVNSCAFRKFGLSDQNIQPDKNTLSLPSLFADTFQTALYKASVDLYGKHFGGLLLVKNMKDGSYRMVMTSETGLGFFDLGVYADSLIVYSCMDKLNKESVLETIAGNLRLILRQNIEKQTLSNLVDEEGLHRVYCYQSGNERTYYFIENKTGYLDRIEKTSSSFRKVSITPVTSDKGVPDSIVFKHYNARLGIRLRLLKNT